MESVSNLSVLFNILFNGMATVFIVLFLVYLLGKIIIYFFDSNSNTIIDNNYNNSNLENTISQKIKEVAGDDAKIISFRKLD